MHVNQRRVAFGVRGCNLNHGIECVGDRGILDHSNLNNCNLDQQHNRYNTSDHRIDDARDDRHHDGNDSEGIDAVELSPKLEQEQLTFDGRRVRPTID